MVVFNKRQIALTKLFRQFEILTQTERQRDRKTDTCTNFNGVRGFGLLLEKKITQYSYKIILWAQPHPPENKITPQTTTLTQ